MLYLFLSLAALSAGPLLLRGMRRGSAFVTAIDGFVVTAVPLLVFFQFVPDAIEARAAWILLALFFCIDTYFYRKEGRVRPDPTPDNPLRISGGLNPLDTEPVGPEDTERLFLLGKGLMEREDGWSHTPPGFVSDDYLSRLRPSESDPSSDEGVEERLRRIERNLQELLKQR